MIQAFTKMLPGPALPTLTYLYRRMLQLAINYFAIIWQNIVNVVASKGRKETNNFVVLVRVTVIKPCFSNPTTASDLNSTKLCFIITHIINF